MEFPRGFLAAANYAGRLLHGTVRENFQRSAALPARCPPDSALPVIGSRLVDLSGRVAVHSQWSATVDPDAPRAGFLECPRYGPSESRWIALDYRRPLAPFPERSEPELLSISSRFIPER